MQQKSILYKNTLQDDDFPFYEIDISKPASKKRLPNLWNVTEDPLFTDRTPVKDIKRKHTFDLLRYIPPHYHAYYNQSIKPSFNFKGKTYIEFRK